MSGSQQWHLTETYKSLISISVEALKLVALVNGGAAIGILTFVGNLAARGQVETVPRVGTSLLCFCGGLVCALLAFMASYLTQLQLYNEEIAIQRGVVPVRTHTWPLKVGVMLALVSVLLFGLGCVLGSRALTGSP
jgi:hypothetical protein